MLRRFRVPGGLHRDGPPPRDDRKPCWARALRRSSASATPRSPGLHHPRSEATFRFTFASAGRHSRGVIDLTPKRYAGATVILQLGVTWRVPVRTRLGTGAFLADVPAKTSSVLGAWRPGRDWRLPSSAVGYLLASVSSRMSIHGFTGDDHRLQFCSEVQRDACPRCRSGGKVVPPVCCRFSTGPVLLVSGFPELSPATSEHGLRARLVRPVALASSSIR